MLLLGLGRYIPASHMSYLSPPEHWCVQFNPCPYAFMLVCACVGAPYKGSDMNIWLCVCLCVSTHVHTSLHIYTQVGMDFEKVEEGTMKC